MKPPEWKDAVLGHPAAGLPIVGLSCFILYLWSNDMALWPAGIGAIISLRAVALASAKRYKYRAWKRAWDSYADTPQRRAMPNKHIIGVTLCIVVIGLLMGQPAQVQHAVALLGITAGVAILILLGLRRLAQASGRRRTSRTQTVTICVRRPVFPVPTLEDAFRALPDHCLRMG